MKLTLVMMVAFLFAAQAGSMAQTMSLSGKNLSLKNVFAAVEKQTGYVTFYNAEILQKTKAVNVSLQDVPLERLLEAVLYDQPLEYIIQGKTIILSRKKGSADGTGVRLGQSTQTVRGVILGSDWQQLVGITISIRDRKTQKVTGMDGSFEIDLSDGDIIQISALGFVGLTLRYTGEGFEDITLTDGSQTVGGTRVAVQQPSKLLASSRTSLQVQMMPSVSPLDEVQIMAYGTTSKRVSTGNITTVSGEDLNMAPITDPLRALQGRVPGMIVTPRTSKPGAPITVQIRGRTQVDQTYGANEEPLFVVDGVPLATQNSNLNMWGSHFTDASAFSMMNMGDIESIEVLKDADATAIYGSRGASGVVLITTKKGKSGATRYNMRVRSGGSRIPLPDLLSTRDYIQFRKEAFANDNVPMTMANAYDLLAWDTTRHDNFLNDLLGKTATFTDVQASVSGGASTIQYVVGASYNRQHELSPQPHPSTTMTTHANLTSTSNDKKFVFNINTSFTDMDNKQSGFAPQHVFQMPPHFKFYEADGSVAWNEGGTYVAGVINPLARLDELRHNKNQTYNISSLLSYAVTQGLTLRANIGYNQSRMKALSTTPISSHNPMGPTKTGSASWADNDFRSYNIEPQLEYVLNNVYEGRLTVLLGGTYTDTRQQGRTLSATGYTNDDYVGSYIGLGASSFTTPMEHFSHYRYAAGFGRVNYNLRNTYILNISGRRDGSSRFGPNYRYSNFASVGAAWALSEEPFFPRNSILSFAKLRGSYGINGNDQIGDYKFLDLYENSFFNGPYAGEIAMTPASFFKPDLHWEMTRKLEFALDAALFGDQLNFTLAWYRHRSADPLVQYPLAALTGFSSVVANLDNVLVDNTGVELSVQGTAIKRTNFEWRSNFNLTIPKNVLKRFDGLEHTTYTRFQVGKSLNSVYYMRYTGVDPETGLHAVADANDDGKYDTNIGGEDMLYYGTSDPTFYGGWQNDLRYKQFSLNVFFQFNRQLRNNYEKGTALFNHGITSLYAYKLDQRWRKPGDITSVPRASQLGNSAAATQGDYIASFSDRLIDRLTWARLETVQLSYALPATLLSDLRLSQANLFIQGQNLWSFYLDSKVGPNAAPTGSLPDYKTITMGVHLTF